MLAEREVRPNDNTGRWDVFEDGAWLAEFESESNALEFAAVPDLLEACRAASEACAARNEGRAYDYDWISAVDAAIAKAEGGE